MTFLFSIVRKSTSTSRQTHARTSVKSDSAARRKAARARVHMMDRAGRFEMSE